MWKSWKASGIFCGKFKILVNEIEVGKETPQMFAWFFITPFISKIWFLGELEGVFKTNISFKNDFNIHRYNEECYGILTIERFSTLKALLNI